MKAFSIRVVDTIKTHSIFLGILVVGFLLRISGLLWGTPFLGPFEGYYHPDEWNIVRGAINFPQYVIDNRWLVYPTFFHTFLGILTFPLRFFFDDFSFPSPEAVGSTFYWVVTVVGRLCSVCAGMGAIVLTYLLSKEVFDQRRALLASAFLAFTLLHATHSSVVTPDVLTSFFLILFLFVLRRAFLKPESATLFVYSGMILGLLVGIKYTGGVVLGAVAVLYGFAIVFHFRQPDYRIRLDYRKFHKNLVLGGGVALGTFLLTTPGFVLHFDGFVDSMTHVTSVLGRRSSPRSDIGTWMKVFHILEGGVGWPLASLFILGIFFPYKKNVYEWSFLAILGIFFVYFESKLLARYTILVAPLMAILASHAVLGICESIRKPIQILGYSSIIFVLVYSIGLSANGRYLRMNDLRTQAAEYLHSAYPEESTLGLAYIRKGSSQRNPLWRTPRIDFSHFKKMDILEYPEVIVASSLVNLTRIKKALGSDKLSEDFVWDPRYNHEWLRSMPPSPEVFRFYHELFESGGLRYRLIKTFKKQGLVSLEHTPSQIDVYVRQSYGPYTTRRSYFPHNPREYLLEEDLRGWRWQLRVEEGNDAELRFPPADRTQLRINIAKMRDGSPGAIQLNQHPIAIQNNEAYVLHFRVRADEFRSVAVGVGQSLAPGQTVGLYQEVPVTKDWQTYALSFRGESNEPEARVHFDLGGSAVPVDIADVELQRQSDFVFASTGRDRQAGSSASELIEPDLPDKYYVNYQFNAMGCRGRDYSIPRLQQGTRILILGDSLALGAAVHQNDTLARQLEILLNQAKNEDSVGENYEVINCGVGGYGTKDADRFYETLGSKYAPDLVLLVVSPDDDQSLIDTTRPELLVRQGSHFVAWSDEQQKLFNRSSPDYSISLKDVRHLQGVLEAQGRTLAVVVFRHTLHPAWTPLIQQFTEAFHGTTVPVLDLGTILLSRHSEEELVVHEGDRHPNEVAHSLAAKTVYDFLKKNTRQNGHFHAGKDALP